MSDLKPRPTTQFLSCCRRQFTFHSNSINRDIIEENFRMCPRTSCGSSDRKQFPSSPSGAEELGWDMMFLLEMQ